MRMSKFMRISADPDAELRYTSNLCIGCYFLQLKSSCLFILSLYYDFKTACQLLQLYESMAIALQRFNEVGIRCEGTRKQQKISN